MGLIIHFLYYLCTRKIKAIARVAKLVDAPDLGSGVLRRVGSSPITRTIIKIGELGFSYFYYIYIVLFLHQFKRIILNKEILWASLNYS